MSEDAEWMFQGLTLGDRSQYSAAPLAWGAAPSSVRWKGDAGARQLALAETKAAFAAIRWNNPADVWSPEVITLYIRLLNKFYTKEALRLLAVIHRIDETGESDGVTMRCVAARVPLVAPDYLRGYASRIRKVAAGNAEGGCVFVLTDADRVVVVPPVVALPPVVAPIIPPVVAPVQPELMLHPDPQALRDARTDELMAMLRQQMELNASQQIMNTRLMEERGNAVKPAEFVTPPKGKTGWARIVEDTKAALIDGVVPPVLKLSRVNRERLIREHTTSSDTRKVLLGGLGGAVLHIPNANDDKTTKVGQKDDLTWSGLSAFFRLFTIMMRMPEEDFPRSKLVDFFDFWAELWDAPRGSRAQKIKATVTFYEKYAEELGTGTWKSRFDTDSRFLLEALHGESPDICRTCGGSGDKGTSVANETAPSNRTSGGGGRTHEPAKRGRDDRAKSYCISMLELSAKCEAKDCRYLHSPCPSCGGACPNAAACAAWDQQKITDKYSRLIAAVKKNKPRKRR